MDLTSRFVLVPVAVVAFTGDLGPSGGEGSILGIRAALSGTQAGDARADSHLASGKLTERAGVPRRSDSYADGPAKRSRRRRCPPLCASGPPMPCPVLTSHTVLPAVGPFSITLTWQVNLPQVHGPPLSHAWP